MNEKVTDKARGMFEKATGWVFCGFGFGFGFGFVLGLFLCFVFVFHCSIYLFSIVRYI